VPAPPLCRNLYKSDLVLGFMRLNISHAVVPQRVEEEATWSLFCPNEAPGLADVWGAEFDALYTKYESEGRARRVLPARQLWFAILEAQVGVEYCLCSLRGHSALRCS